MTEDTRGPDLANGIDAARLVEGRPLEGRVGEHAVVLVRRGETIHALGARCPHRGAALADGLVVGDTIRCPWHHASFALADGAARAPALEPLPCWRVERDGGTVTVRERAAFDTPPAMDAATTHAGAAAAPASVVIVGAGAAGDSVAATLRAHGYGGPVTLLSADDRAPIDRTNLSKGYLAGDIDDDAALALRDAAFYRAHDIDLRLGARVESIDRAAREVRLEGGGRVPYAKLVLATGADAVRLTVPGADDERVHVLRTLEDARGIVRAARDGRRAVVVGASFIGLEAAAALRARDIETTVVAPDDVPLGTVMGETLGTFVRELHERHGVTFRLGAKVGEIVPDGVRLEDGEVLPADLIVVGIGVAPATGLAEAAGLDVDDGVLVDARLITSDPDILAVGDIARWPDPRGGGRARVEHWQLAQRHGECAARNLLGADEPFTDVPFFWSKHYGTNIRYSGHADGDARVATDGSPADGDFAAVFSTGDGERRAMASVGRDRANLAFAARLGGELGGESGGESAGTVGHG